MIPALTSPTSTVATASTNDEQLRQVAMELESAFLSEMLKGAGLRGMSSSFGGGAGEDHFSSYLRDEQSRLIAESGGIGLAQSIFEALKEAENGN